jgi:NAD(P)H-dependent flavin oxidoreductase YrpB (nitropropane dioxygenase family)
MKAGGVGVAVISHFRLATASSTARGLGHIASSWGVNNAPKHDIIVVNISQG